MAEKPEYESGARKLMAKRDRDANDDISKKAAENRRSPSRIENTENDPPRDVRESPTPDLQDNARTADQKPRWEGPPGNRPRGYLQATDDPENDRDAAGENLKDPDKRDLGDALKQKGE